MLEGGLPLLQGFKFFAVITVLVINANESVRGMGQDSLANFVRNAQGAELGPNSSPHIVNFEGSEAKALPNQLSSHECIEARLRAGEKLIGCLPVFRREHVRATEAGQALEQSHHFIRERDGVGPLVLHSLAWDDPVPFSGGFGGERAG